MNKHKQRGYLTGMQSAVTFLMALLGAFWFCVGLGLGWWLWH